MNQTSPEIAVLTFFGVMLAGVLLEVALVLFWVRGWPALKGMTSRTRQP